MLLWVKNSKKCLFFHIVPISIVILMWWPPQTEVEISCNSAKHSVDGVVQVCQRCSLQRQKGCCEAVQAAAAGGRETPVCLALPLVAFILMMYWEFGIWLYLYPSSMFPVLWLYRDVFKSFNVLLWSSVIVWCVVIATILNKRMYLREFCHILSLIFMLNQQPFFY